MLVCHAAARVRCHDIRAMRVRVAGALPCVRSRGGYDEAPKITRSATPCAIKSRERRDSSYYITSYDAPLMPLRYAADYCALLLICF